MRTFGIIGFPLSHSFSQRYFSEKFEKEEIKDAVFQNFPIENIEALKDVLQNNASLKGLAVTIPYKKAVLPYLFHATETVKQMGACNCIKISDGKLFGYNTDVIGFEESFVKHLEDFHTKALILGTGGAAAAVEFVLKKLQIGYRFVSRNASVEKNIFSYKDLNNDVMKEYNIIINCTPLGTYPKVDECPAIPYYLLTPNHYLFDLVYNPAKTKFLQQGEEKGATIENGYEMLVIQAEENWNIWNS